MSKDSTQKTFPVFSMINDFESKAFHVPELKAQHRSLYYFLLGVLIHRRGAKRFEIAYDYGMAGSKIGNHKTYTDTLKDLQKYGFIKYTPGKNRFSTPVIDMQFCKPTANLLQTYCTSIGVSTANNIKAEEANDTEEANNTPKDESLAAFEKFWDLYQKRVDRKKCETAWQNLTKKDRLKILATVEAYVIANPEKKYRKNPLTYLNGHCWNDEIEAVAKQDERQTLIIPMDHADYYGGINPNFAGR